MMTVVAVSPRLRLVARKSAAVSPTVVAMILITQNSRVTWGTLLSMVLACCRAGVAVVVMGCSFREAAGRVLGGAVQAMGSTVRRARFRASKAPVRRR